MKKINFGILDDNEVEVKRLEKTCSNYLSKNKIAFICSTFTKVDEFLNSDIEAYDVVFFDIDINEHSGIDLAIRLKEVNKKCLICFVTNYPDFVFDSCSLHAFDYVLKPINEMRIARLLDDIIDYFNDNCSALDYNVQLNCIDKLVNIKCKDIIYFEYHEKYSKDGISYSRIIKVKTINNEFLMKDKLKTIINFLPSSLFIMPHQSFILNMHHIKYFKQAEIVMTNNVSIPISQKREANVRECVVKFFQK